MSTLIEDLEGAPCMNCPEGQYQASAATRTLERGETILVVREVPALVCGLCGETAFSPAVSERLEELVEEAAAGGVETLVRRWREPQPT
jgi:YgiT-type zinc finger domain-containing protein